MNVCFKNPVRVAYWQYIFLLLDQNSTILWFYGISILIIMGLVFYLRAEFENRQMDLLLLVIWGFALVVGVSIRHKNYIKLLSSRLTMGFTMICVFWTISIYNAFFFGILVHPKYYPKVTSLEQALALNYSFVSPAEFLVRKMDIGKSLIRLIPHIFALIRRLRTHLASFKSGKQ